MIVLASTLGVAVAAALGALWWLNSSLQRLPVSLPGTGGVWLIVGVDDRAAADERILEDTGTGEPGARADVLLLARADGDTLRLLSVDRRVVALDAAGIPGRLGASWLEGPQRAIDLFCHGLGVGVDHLIQVDFGSLVEVVDALGGIEVELEYALRDGPAHLSIDSGVQQIDGRTALALVRSRQGELLVDGQWQPETQGAEARQRRAGMVLASVMRKMKQSELATQWDAANVARQRLKLDPATGVQDVLGLRNLALDPEVLRTEPVSEEDLMTSLLPEGEQQLEAFRDGTCE